MRHPHHPRQQLNNRDTLFFAHYAVTRRFTPKSHCEHVRKTVTTVAGVNAAVCQFLPPEQSSPASNRIREVFGSASNFVAWYTSHLRSGVGKKFTAADIADYERLQLKLSQALQPTQ